MPPESNEGIRLRRSTVVSSGCGSCDAGGVSYGARNRHRCGSIFQGVNEKWRCHVRCWHGHVVGARIVAPDDRSSRFVTPRAWRCFCSLGAGHEGEAYASTGPGSLGIAQAAKTIGQVAGRDVSFSYGDVSEAAAREAAFDAGVPAWMTDAMLALPAFDETGYAAGLSDDRERPSESRGTTSAELAQRRLVAGLHRGGRSRSASFGVWPRPRRDGARWFLAPSPPPLVQYRYVPQR